MAITVQCGGCGKQFRADERFAGKRMRCKSCGTIFVVAAGDGGADLTDDQSLLSGISDAAAESTRTGAPVPPQSAPPAWAPPVQIISADEPIKNHGVRRSVAFDFPFADLLDAWAPRLVVFGCLAWLLFEAFNASGTGPIWVPYGRLALLLALFGIVILPLTVRGIEQAARKFRFTYPPSPGWRTFATFIFPFTLAYVLWHVSGDAGSIILGCVSGLIVSLGLFWFLFRIVPRELPMSFAYAAASFLISAAIVGAIVFGLNVLALNVAKGMRQAHQFASSPLGPGLGWDSTPPPPEEKKSAEKPKPREKSPPAATPPREPTEPEIKSPPPVARAATPTPASPVAPQAPETPPTPAPEAETPRERSIFDEDSFVAEPEVADAPSAEDSPVAAKPDPARAQARIARRAAPLVESGAGPLPGAGSEILQSVTEAPVDSFDQIIFSETPGTYFALLRRIESADEDEIELWDSARYELKSAVRFRRDPAAQSRYILSPDGKHLLRLVSWPRVMVQVWSFDEEKIARNITLNDRYGVPQLVGFSSDEVFIVSWKRGMTQGIESFNAVTAKRVKQIDLPEHQRSDANFAVSANGLRGAIAARDQEDKPVIQIIDLSGGPAARRWQIRSLRDDAVARPAGLAFSREGDKLAALFEQGGGVLVVGWRVADGKVLFEQIFQSDRAAMRLPDNAAGPARSSSRQPARAPRQPAPGPRGAMSGARGQDQEEEEDTSLEDSAYEQLPAAIDWLPDASAVIVRGLWLIDAGSGETLADIPLRGALAQRVLDDQRIEIVHRVDSQSRLAVITLDLDALARSLTPSPRRVSD